MKPDLLGYVLHLLEPEEERAVEAYLEATPEARKELLRMRPLLKAMEQDDEEPSKELIYQTLRAVASERSTEPATAGDMLFSTRGNSSSRQLPKLEPWAIKEYEAAPTTWRRADAWALIAVIMLILLGIPPVLHYVRDHAGQMECRENMRQFYAAFSQYMGNHRGSIPALAAQGPESRAGIYATKLREEGLWGARMRLGCPPGSPTLPASLAEVKKHTDDEEGYWKEFAGNYAYHLGYLQESEGKTKIMQVKQGDGDCTPILADRPARFGELTGWATANSPNHGFAGQNVLMLGGAVLFLKTRSHTHGCDQDIYRNQTGQPYASKCLQDHVLGPCEARPTAVPLD